VNAVQVKRAAILELEDAMRGVDNDFEADSRHYFGHQTYVREMRLTAGGVIVGKLHRYPCVNILSRGCVRVEGEFESATYEAPYTWVSCAGTKRAVIALDDVVWSTVHQNPTGTEDLTELERYLIADSYEALEAT
jgi:hypothetical protein